VTSLQKALADALKRVELTHSTLTTTHITATARLSEANNSLQAEVQELEVGTATGLQERVPRQNVPV